MPKKIIFLTNQLSVRGTEVALYDYAYFNQELLNHSSIVAYKKNSLDNDSKVIEKFKGQFELLPYENLRELERLPQFNSADLMYVIKSGEIDDLVSQVIPTMVHAVFPQNPKMVHGSAYAFVSEWLSKFCSNGAVPAVPHIVSLPKVDTDLRSELGISKDVTVFGCYGGATSFDLPFAKKVIFDLVQKRSDIHFIFMNITEFVKHPRVIFLPGTANLIQKVKFINTCDAMLHARKLGESFGLACAEFSIRNKPVLTYSKSLQRHHLDVLGHKAFLYSGYSSLYKQLNEFDRVKSASNNWDCYSDKFSPNKVMNLFDQHLIQPATKNGLVSAPDYPFSWKDRLICQARSLSLKAIKLSRYWS